MSYTNENPSNFEIEEEDLKIDIDYEKRRVTIHHRYEWLQIISDLLLGIWFLVGSIFFFFTDLMKAGTWLFVLGSTQMLIGPILRVAQKVHTKKIESKNHHL